MRMTRRGLLTAASAVAVTAVTGKPAGAAAEFGLRAIAEDLWQRGLGAA